MFKIITSTQNDQIKSVVALHDAKQRRIAKKFIAEGLRTISTLISGGAQLYQIYSTQTMLDEAQTLAQPNQLILVIDDVMKKVSQTVSPSGLLAIFEMPAELAPSKLTAGLVITQITDPGNMGTLLRTCVAMNVKTVVLVEGVDPYNFKCIQSSAGTIAQLNIFQLDWHELLEHKKQLKLYALVVTQGQDIKLVQPTNALLVLGNEAHGLPQQWIEDCDQRVTISMPGKTESLNAAVAGSIALYEVFGEK